MISPCEARIPRAAIYLAVFVSTPGRRYHGVGALASSNTLSQAYRDIAARSNLLDWWPDSRKFCQDCLVYDEASNSYELPTFSDGQGPLGVFGFLQDNQSAQGVMGPCDIIFAEFCSKVKSDILNNDSSLSRAMDRWILHPPPSSQHISVAILQEHISSLREQADIDNWKPIPHSSIQLLARSLMLEHQSKIQAAPELELDSLLWTPDGALIAGFLDTTSEQSFDKLRSSSRRIGRDVLGHVLTTRPKNLIHATIGRVVGLPPGCSPNQLKMLTCLAQEYNERILPDAVVNIKTQTPSFTLDELTLARNIVWMLKEYSVYQSWSLSSFRDS